MRRKTIFATKEQLEKFYDVSIPPISIRVEMLDKKQMGWYLKRHFTDKQRKKFEDAVAQYVRSNVEMIKPFMNNAFQYGLVEMKRRKRWRRVKSNSMSSSNGGVTANNSTVKRKSVPDKSLDEALTKLFGENEIPPQKTW